MNTVFLNMWLISPWLIWNSYLLYYIYVDDKSFQFVITSRRQQLFYWCYVVIFLFLGIYIFIIRLFRINLSLNVYKILDIFQGVLNLLSYREILGIGLFSLLLIVFWMLLLRHSYECLKKCLYSLYLYYYQYGEFRSLISFHNSVCSGFTRFLVRRVKIFTRNEKIIGNTLTIWPYCILVVEGKLFSYLIPYTLVFDVITKNGEIQHLFLILPWFYMYGLLRSTSKLLTNFFISKDLSFIEAVYGLK